jgi:hypothetical protein
MGDAGLTSLAHWANFYVITGSAAAALTGLQFVVIVLGAQLNSGGNEETNRAFGTPTIVHFSTVLLISAIMSAPWPMLGEAALILGLCGAAGLIYAVMIIRTVRRQTAYRPVLEDWIWHFTLPPLAYAILLATATQLQASPANDLFAVASVALLLLFIGIHNAWDSATFIALHMRRGQAKREEQSQGD